MVSRENIRMRDDFCIEHYVTDQGTAAEEKPVTEILIPSS
jgi:hypothetical protein